MAKRSTPTGTTHGRRRARTARTGTAGLHVSPRSLAGGGTRARARTAGAPTGDADQHPDRPGQNERAAYRKVSVTIPGAVIEEARERAGRGGLSAYVASAVEAQLAADRLHDLLTHLDSVYGPVPEEMIAQAEAAWPSEHGDR